MKSNNDGAQPPDQRRRPHQGRPENINNTPEDISHAASGHKANLSNPTMFSLLAGSMRCMKGIQASKEKSKEALKELGGEEAFYGKQGKGE
ncbi:hypothetical protein P171DRAFT_427462 [Karstenula rhodostoma CBS 690.94]|uniref:Conidiation-specific protein 6 n=1 Tax=Karstenula rhodostoma CBS 690.94 TaxID=1392251 RepID=A0A9P4UGI5_9PLEO|nr:hypothetical protein P171DRAFT_427462 [Karstenula rhodostoma CBS 690.94]